MTPSDHNSQNYSACFCAHSPQLSQPDNREQSHKRPSSTSTPVKEKPKTWKRNRRTMAASNNASQSNVINIVQDSDKENWKIDSDSSKKQSPFKKITDYFEEPANEDEGDTGDKLWYKCRWCRNIYKNSPGTFCNLKKHCDGNHTSLIVKAGLHALHLASDELINSPKSTLGFVCGLAPIDEESKELKPKETYVTEDVELGNNPLEANEFDNEEYTAEQGSPHLLLNDLSTQHGQKASKFVDPASLLTTESTGTSNFKKLEGGQNYYSNLNITASEWEVVNQVNETLNEFYFLTKKMEGNYSSGSMMISEYHQIKEVINTKLRTTDNPELKAMLRRMLTKTDTYPDESLTCDTILIATALNLCFQLGGTCG
ncbi:hypothetical protein PSTG_13052 [Puccinia striiformis f. sp. tritici PST-78]|uniref:Uncharacterized protein n=1 Tax=Puccinia striiformis f. sp. tritici PST-78 TaxID=1165861 RepID=A0A0L0V2S7_9BASI|nr:hypothetical protein PSTG_13052 [Puccinia striiformis f. sp. tritici PST-78]